MQDQNDNLSVADAFDCSAAQQIACATMLIILGHDGFSALKKDGRCSVRATNQTFEHIASGVALGIQAAMNGSNLPEDANKLMLESLQEGLRSYITKPAPEELIKGTQQHAALLFSEFNQIYGEATSGAESASTIH